LLSLLTEIMYLSSRICMISEILKELSRSLLLDYDIGYVIIEFIYSITSNYEYIY